MSEQNQHPAVLAIEAAAERFHQIAPPSLKFESEMGFAFQLLSNNDYLMKAAIEQPKSLQSAIVNVAAIGLSLNPAEKLAYLIPRTVSTKVNGQKVWQTRIFLEPSYMGMCRLATNSGSIEWVQARCVYASDEFIDNGLSVEPTHKNNPFASREDRGEFVGVYCVAKTHTGDYLTTTMSAERIKDIMERSEGYKAFVEKKVKSCVWVTDFEEQAKKTVVRNAFKMWPRSDQHDRMALAVDLSNVNEGFEEMVTEPKIARATANQKEVYDGLISENDAIGMFLFQSELPESVRNDLYHSFPKGKKGQFQKIVDELYINGRNQLTEYINILSEAVHNGDEGGIQECRDELTDEAWDYLCGEVEDLGEFMVEAA